ncbi:MAG: hydratase [Geminicoccaceae bacterium]
MTAAADIRACDILFDCWMNGRHIEALPEELRPRDRRQGHAIQAQLEKRDPGGLAGWKIAATSAAGQAHIGVSGPIAGRIFRSRLVPDGGTVALAGNLMRVAEVEFAFRMAHDLPPREQDYTLAEVLDAVESLHPAIELPDSRFADFATAGEAQLIADNACAHYFCIGAATGADWRNEDLAALKVEGRIAERDVVVEGAGAFVLGDPREALLWLANELRSLGITLAAGQFVSTGTAIVPAAIERGDRFVADLGPHGSVCLQMS